MQTQKPIAGSSVAEAPLPRMAMEEKYKRAAMERDIRERLFPKPGDLFYLHLSDLLIAVKEAATSEPIALLDYGAGFCPYRELFPQSNYVRADIPAVAEANKLGREEVYPDPDCVILPDGRVDHESGKFDYVLSTQVLEHVRDPEIYLAEAFRLVKPGGKLFLTTHGTWPDHGSPYDFRRWTPDGLRYDIEKVGFTVRRVQKLTTGPRAMLSFVETYLWIDDTPTRRTPLGMWHWLSRRFLPRRLIQTQADLLYPNCRVVSSDEPGHKIYLCLAVLAEKES
jgi:SAM-dependent methyltransferase